MFWPYVQPGSGPSGKEFPRRVHGTDLAYRRSAPRMARGSSGRTAWLEIRSPVRRELAGQTIADLVHQVESSYPDAPGNTRTWFANLKG